MVLMANTKPPVDNEETLRYVLEKGGKTGIHVESCANITVGMKGTELTDMDKLAENGAAALLDSCQDPAAALKLLERRGVETPTVVEALAALYGGDSLILPLLDGAGPGLIDWEEWRIAA